MRTLLFLALAAAFLAGCSSNADTTDDANAGDDAGADSTMNATANLATHFEFGPTAGCASDANALSGGLVPPNCISFNAGPMAPAVDGHWIPLNESYVGLQVTSDFVTQAPATPATTHDSDCFFVAADATTLVGEAHNGAEVCTGVVPEGAAWMFYYPWGVPADSMTLDFAIATE